MKTKNIATLVQRKIARALPGQLQRSRPILEHPSHGECWPHSVGHKKTTMWQSPGWPASGKNIPHDAQRLSSHFKKR